MCPLIPCVSEHDRQPVILVDHQGLNQGPGVHNAHQFLNRESTVDLDGQVLHIQVPGNRVVLDYHSVRVIIIVIDTLAGTKSTVDPDPLVDTKKLLTLGKLASD